MGFYNRLKRIKIIVCALLVLNLVLSGCGNSSSPKRIAEKFFSAVKSGDNEKAMECFTPSIQAEYKAAMSISDGLFGIDSSALWGGIVGLANTDYYRNYEFKVKDYSKTDANHAVVNVDVYTNGNYNSTTKLHCIAIDGEWYVEY